MTCTQRGLPESERLSRHLRLQTPLTSANRSEMWLFLCFCSSFTSPLSSPRAKGFAHNGPAKASDLFWTPCSEHPWLHQEGNRFPNDKRHPTIDPLRWYQLFERGGIRYDGPSFCVSFPLASFSALDVLLCLLSPLMFVLYQGGWDSEHFLLSLCLVCSK